MKTYNRYELGVAPGAIVAGAGAAAGIGEKVGGLVKDIFGFFGGGCNADDCCDFCTGEILGHKCNCPKNFPNAYACKRLNQAGHLEELLATGRVQPCGNIQYTDRGTAIITVTNPKKGTRQVEVPANTFQALSGGIQQSGVTQLGVIPPQVLGFPTEKVLLYGGGALLLVVLLTRRKKRR